MKQVIKRDGKEVKFNLKKIVSAIRRAGESSGEFGYDEALDLTNSVIQMFDNKEKATVEEIQDAVEKVLNENNYTKTARAFIVYREKHNDMRKDNSVMIDAVQSIDDYLDRSDWRVNANANQGYSLGGMILNTSGKVTANYWLSHVYPKEAGEAHRNGDIQIHDLDMLANYCTGWSLRALLQEGFNGVKGKVESNPPKHLASALGQMVNFWGCLQNENAGAQAFSSFDTYLAPYVRNDKLTYKQVYDAIQEFVFNVNVPSRWGTQTPFTNITLDWTCPEDLKDSQPIISGEEMDYTYSELQPEMDMINKAFIEVMIKGDAHGRLFTFPIPTYNITPDFPWGSENTKLLFEMTAKYGLPYFQNFLNSDLKVGDVRSMCCRLQLDLREIKKRGGGLFGSGEQTGSIGVITINCARLGYLFKNDITGLYKRLDELMNIARNALEQKRKSLNKWMEQGLYPYSKRYLGGYNTLFSTIGINGVNEMIRNFTNDEHDITDDYGQKFAMSLMDHINEVLKQFQVETGNLYNLEATPGEGTTFRFAKEDKKRYPDIIQAGKPEAPYYTNSTQIPVGYTNDPFTALNLQEGLQRRYSGGCVEAGNYVITNEGTILIEDIVKNFDKDNPLYVASFNKDTNTTEWDKVIDAVEIDVSKKDKINIKGEGNFNITTSDWHPFFVLQEDGSVVEKRADELKKNDKMITSNCCLFDDNERELTEEQAYLIGYFIGDGSLTKRIDNRGGNHLERYKVRFFDEKEEVLEKVRNIIKSNKFGDVNIIQTDKRSKKLKEVQCNSKSCADFFLKYGFHAGSKTYTVNIPDEVKCQLNKKNAYALLSGLIDSDSHVDANGDVEYMTASVQLGYDIVWLCTMLGLSVSKTFKIDPRWPSTKLSRINIWHNSLLDIVEKLNTVKKVYINQQKRPHSKLARKFNFVRVKETSKVDVEDNIFYDLTTENNHNYLCGKERFVFIHNTVIHLYMGEAMSSSDSCKTLVKRVLENYHIPYLTITPTFSICPKHGYISGEHKYCPICDEELTSPKQEQCKACKG